MKNIFVITLMILSNTANCQDQDEAMFDPTTIDHLEPLDSYGTEGFYTDKIIDSDLLMKNEYITVQFLKFPMCKTPTAIALIGNNEDNSKKIAFTHSTKPLKKARKRHIKTLYRDISYGLASKLQQLYESVLINTHYSLNNQNVWMLDCSTAYHFYGYGPKYRPMVGGAVNPMSGTPPDTLVKTSAQLEAFVKKDTDEKLLGEFIEQALKQVSTYKSK